MTGGFYESLCHCARRAGLHVELVAGQVLHRQRFPNGMAESRNLVELVLSHESGRVLATERLRGLGDLQRASQALLDRVGLLKS